LEFHAITDILGKIKTGCPTSRVLCEKWGFSRFHLTSRKKPSDHSLHAVRLQSSNLSVGSQKPHFSQKTREVGHPIHLFRDLNFYSDREIEIRPVLVHGQGSLAYDS